jgi:hypothetical protein
MDTTFFLLAVGKNDLRAIALLFFIVAAFALLKVSLAWGGVFLSSLGFCLFKSGRGARRGRKSDAEQHATLAVSEKSFRFMTHGPVAGALIIGGIALAIVDVWRNGSGVYPAAVEKTRDAIALGTGDAERATKAARKRSDELWQEEKLMVKQLEKEQQQMALELAARTKERSVAVKALKFAQLFYPNRNLSTRRTLSQLLKR